MFKKGIGENHRRAYENNEENMVVKVEALKLKL